MFICHGSTELVRRTEIRISENFLDFETEFYYRERTNKKRPLS